ANPAAGRVGSVAAFLVRNCSLDATIGRMVKVRKGAASVAGYFARIPARPRNLLRERRDTIRSVVPREAVEVMSYRMPAFKHGHVLVWYAAFADHLSLFPGGSVLVRF